ncbi:carbohydrate porin [Verrucomicrobia bacterium LW23]|nr:carbohydrate porin [Verrucomicrobia bacterium LW23]
MNSTTTSPVLKCVCKSVKAIIHIFAITAVCAFSLSAANAGPPAKNGQESPAAASFPSKSWLEGDYATGNWGGARDRLHDRGVDFFAYYNAIVAGNVSGGTSRRAAYADDFYFGVTLDLQKLTGWQGATFMLSGVNRDGESITPSIGSQYDVMQLVGGQNIFLYQITLEQKLLDDRVAFKMGRLSAGDDFATSPLYGLYLNNAIDGNIRAALFDTRFSAYPFPVWGGRLRIEPTPNTYIMSGAYQVSDDMFNPNRNGLDMAIRNTDGFLWLNQAGFTTEFNKPESAPSGAPDPKAASDPKSTATRRVNDRERNGGTGLKGHYFAGAWWSSYDYPRFGSTTPQSDSFGFYLHADQMLWQEEPGSAQGLTAFTTLTYAPQPCIAIVPLQSSMGLLYRGLIPGRDNDMAIFGFTYGSFSRDYATAQQAAGNGRPQEEMVAEWGYRIQLTPWSYFQPDVQYVIRPGGTGNIPDAVVIGTQFGLKF